MKMYVPILAEADRNTEKIMLDEMLAEQKAKLDEQKAQIAEQNTQLAEQKTQLAEKDAEIAALKAALKNAMT